MSTALCSTFTSKLRQLWRRGKGCAEFSMRKGSLEGCDRSERWTTPQSLPAKMEQYPRRLHDIREAGDTQPISQRNNRLMRPTGSFIVRPDQAHEDRSLPLTLAVHFPHQHRYNEDQVSMRVDWILSLPKIPDEV